MFLHRGTLTKMLKQAYKDGLKIAMDNGWLYLAGLYWEASIKSDFVPKETLGEIIKLTGALPGEGEKWECTADGNQTEMPIDTTINPDNYRMGPLTITDTLQIGTKGTIQRFVQDESTGVIYVINNVFVNLVDKKNIEYDKGEYEPGDPMYSAYGVLWQNNVCRLKAHFRTDEKNNKIMESLKGVDITPEVP